MMNRRGFIPAISLSAGQLLFSGCVESRRAAKKSSAFDPDGIAPMLAGMTFDELERQYRSALFDNFLPFMDSHIIDHEHGGFMCTADRDGTLINTNKRTSYQARGIWIYSYLFNTLDRNPSYLAIARKAVDFIFAHHDPAHGLLPYSFTREGAHQTFHEAVSDDMNVRDIYDMPGDIPSSMLFVPGIGATFEDPDGLIYDDIFFAAGLLQFAKATGDGVYRSLARDILFSCLDIYDNRRDYGSLLPGNGREAVRSPRILPHWREFLTFSTQYLETGEDTEVAEVAKRCVDAIMNHHYNPAYNLINLYCNHDLSRIEGGYGAIVTGDAQQALWMVMDEALRTGDNALFTLAAERLRRHIEVMWDDVYGGLFGALADVDENRWGLDKALWTQDEALIGLMTVFEYTGAQWAADWFGRLFTCVREKFYLDRYHLPLWIIYADRKVTFTPHYNRIDNFHHTRQLIRILCALSRMKNSRSHGNTETT